MKKYNLAKCAMGGTFLLIALVLNALFFPSVPSNAETVRGAEVGASVKEFIKLAVDTTTLALSDGTTTVITPSPSGTLITGDVNLAVTTNSIKGYVLSVYTADGSTGMSHSNSNVGTEIESIAGVSGYNANTGLSTLSADTWGFRKYQSSSSTYSNWYGVGENSSNGTLIASTDSDDADFCGNLSYPLASTGCTSDTYDTYLVNFGAKVSTNLPAGTYTNNVTFSAIAKSEGSAYTLNFGANGGQNVMGPRTILSGSTITLPTEGFVKEGRAIKGWALVDNATPSTPPSTSPIYLAGSNVQVNDLVEAAIAAGQSVSSTSELTLYAVWDIPYIIAYNGNNATSGSTTSQSTFLTNNTNTIKANGYTRTDYNFLGWALTSSATTPNSDIDPNDTISTASLISLASAAGQSVSTTQSGTINLYAVWEQVRSLSTITYMQDMDSEVCANTPANTTKSLIDRRDSSSYSVKKIGNDCWMTQNLRLGYDKGYALTKELTNIPDNDDGTLSNNGTYYLPQAGNSGALNSSSSTGSAVFDTSTRLDQAQVQYRAQGQGGDQSSSGTLGQNTGYYNFYAATLGCSYYNGGSSCYSGYTSRDICPKGWQLPAGGSNTTKSWVSLDKALNGSSAGSNRTDATARDNFLNNAGFLYSGVYYSSQLYDVGSYGYWWSSTVNDTNLSYRLYLSSNGNVDPQYYNDKYDGFAVRCVSKT